MRTAGPNTDAGLARGQIDTMTDTREVMVLEENGAMRNFLYASVTAAGCEAAVTDNPQDAIRRFRTKRPDAVILSLGATRSTRALRTIAVLHAIDPSVPIIVISGHARASMIAQALNRGASDFITAPFDETDIELAVTKAFTQPAVPGTPARRDYDRQSSRTRLTGASPAMTRVREFIDRAAATDLTVLIRGEGGTGKTLVAREIVAASPRWNQPFVKVNCTARQDELLDAEVLALGPGGFGGALTDLTGKFATADRGTLFLDEIGEMSLAMQAKLLKILQEREYAHLNGHQSSLPDVRIIAASSADLERAIAEGRFREELFFRLNVLSVALPPLRERREDIPELAEQFLKIYAAQYNAPHRGLSDATVRQLVEYDWPGNVRELENLIRRIVLLGAEASMTHTVGTAPVTSENRPTDTNGAIEADPVWSLSLKQHARMAAREAERALILRTLEQTNWNRKEAASLLGISYKALLRKIKEWDLQNT